MNTAEGLVMIPDQPVDWVQKAASDEALATYAVESAFRSREDANTSVQGLEEKAANLVNLDLALIPFALAGTTFALTRETSPAGWWWTSVILFFTADILLVGSAILGFLTSGLRLHAGLNIARLTKPDSMDPVEPSKLKSEEALAWHYSAVMAMEVATVKAAYLFRARQLVILAVTAALFAILASGFVL